MMVRKEEGLANVRCPQNVGEKCHPFRARSFLRRWMLSVGHARSPQAAGFHAAALTSCDRLRLAARTGGPKLCAIARDYRRIGMRARSLGSRMKRPPQISIPRTTPITQESPTRYVLAVAPPR